MLPEFFQAAIEVNFMLRDSLLSCKSMKEKAYLVWDHYKSRKLNSSFEPIWTHAGYELVQKFLDDKLPEKSLNYFKDVMATHELPDGFEVSSFPNVPSSPIRIVHDCWKIGTPTWIFMGRNFPGAIQQVAPEWIAVQRKLPENLTHLFDPAIPKNVWMAYNLKDQMGLGAATANCIGPALYLEDLLDVINRQKKM